MRQLVDERGIPVQGFYRNDDGSIVRRDKAQYDKYMSQSNRERELRNQVSELTDKVDQLTQLVNKLVQERQ